MNEERSCTLILLLLKAPTPAMSEGQRLLGLMWGAELGKVVSNSWQVFWSPLVGGPARYEKTWSSADPLNPSPSQSKLAAPPGSASSMAVSPSSSRAAKGPSTRSGRDSGGVTSSGSL